MKNAFYALRGREDAHIILSAEHGPTGKVLIRVRDNGPGIPPEIMNEIFVPFFTTKEEGSGIGLSVSRQIMRMHGGNLKASSIEGKETVFTIII
ncbi:MAG: ATP-binding protein [Butyricimonas paravirosa]